MGFLTFFGRVLIVTAIVSSAYYHLEHPENSINEFKDNYSTIDALSNQYLKFDIPLDQVFPFSKIDKLENRSQDIWSLRSPSCASNSPRGRPWRCSLRSNYPC